MFTIHYFETVDSTMDIARSNLRHGHVIQAGAQTGGRGRRGNQWASPTGNLYQSIILKPSRPIAQWGQLSFVIAVALSQSLLSFLRKQEHQNAKSDPRFRRDDNKKINLKWPNDVLIGDKKLAGILIEIANDHVIIGTGVNIKHAPSDRAKISDFSDISVNDFRDVFLEHIETYFNIWQVDGFAPIRALWMARAYKRGETIQARLPNIIYEGIFEDLNDQGILLLREKSGTVREINSGEIIAV
jgi:BirA family biotin operon repressor/biotin-[acetyl-CoA-carboxylase] ligase